MSGWVQGVNFSNTLCMTAREISSQAGVCNTEQFYVVQFYSRTVSRCTVIRCFTFTVFRYQPHDYKSHISDEIRNRSRRLGCERSYSHVCWTDLPY
jgi:hypothetical protein